ncbi:hypothetical protein ABER02_06500 [Rossellomorea marisflavi]|uniref:hypothetical protein n=1 Tax=Rossellomorea marisflavi TaxID=189381 RepID=UPI003D29BB6D
MTCHILIATIRNIDVESTRWEEEFGIGLKSAEQYRGDVPFTLPYLYEAYDDDLPLLMLLNELMAIGDVVELYEYCEGKKGGVAVNRREEAVTVNLHQKTYQDQHGTYKLNSKKWLNDLATTRYLTDLSVTTFLKY